MGKLLIILGILISCAGSKNRGQNANLSISMKDNLYRNQDELELIKLLKDPYLLKAAEVKCSNNWGATVDKYKESLKREKNILNKARLWHKLGDCFLLVGEYKKSIYYYDLVEASGLKDTKILAVMYYNLGQIFESFGQLVLAKTYYELAYKNDDPKSFSLFKLALIEHRLGEFDLSNSYIKKLIPRFPKSESIRFIMGVNYFHMKKLGLIKSKVLSRLDEKSNSRVLLELAIGTKTKQDKEKLRNDIVNFETNFGLHNSFKKYLISTLD